MFEQLAADDFEDIPEDGDWLITMTLIAECCLELQDSRRAALLYELLLPYARANVVIGLAAVCLGSAARYLGRLAALTGRREEAFGHFERALRANGMLRTPVYLAHAQIDYAIALGGDPRGGELLAEAARMAEQLQLPLVAHRAARAL
jgi:tetratricopeptide (TPR) repeat protein